MFIVIFIEFDFMFKVIKNCKMFGKLEVNIIFYY